MNNSRFNFMDSIHTIWTIASKDILESLRNKLIISLILGMSFMLLVPKLMALMLVPPEIPVIVYDPGESQLTTKLDETDQYRVQRALSVSELKHAIGSTGFGLGVEFGLVFPKDIDQAIEAGEQPEVDGFVAWTNRMEAPRLKTEFEAQLERVAGHPVRIHTEGNVVYPPPDTGLWLLMATITPVIVILILGIQLVPTLLFEEKQTKTMDALLVSPASIGQIVVGKALAGLIYVTVAAGVVFAINWSGVVHWELALLFTLGVGVFSVGLGLVLGSFFERQQDVIGLTMLLIVVFIGALFIDMLSMDIPVAIRAIIPWIPSVALAEIIRFAFLEAVPWGDVLVNLGSMIGFTLIFYGFVVWKVRRSDR